MNHISVPGTTPGRIFSTLIAAVFSLIISGGLVAASGHQVTPRLAAQQAECTNVLSGYTLWPVDAGDISVRDKSGFGGEVNADGWGSNLRLYGGTDVDMYNVVATFVATAGFTFEGSSNSAQTPGAGALQGNGYTGAGTGLAVTVSSGTVTVTLDFLPAFGSFSVNAPIVRSEEPVDVEMTSTMSGLVQCPPTEVPPTEIPPTEVPPTEVPPTDVPATEVPTDVPSTEAPATEVPATTVPGETPTEPAATEAPVQPTEVAVTEAPAETTTTPVTATQLPSTGSGNSDGGNQLVALTASALVAFGLIVVGSWKRHSAR